MVYDQAASYHLPGGVTAEHIRQSNLIEQIDDPAADVAMEQAWRWLATWNHLDQAVVLTVHWRVTADQLGLDAGRLRRVGVRVGGRVCPPPEQVSGLLAVWLREMRDWRTLDPQEAHVRFEKIHPFVDGNGRVGRLLLWLHQMWLGQPPILLRASERHRYYEWFREPGEPGEVDEYRRYLRAMMEEATRD